MSSIVKANQNKFDVVEDFSKTVIFIFFLKIIQENIRMHGKHTKHTYAGLSDQTNFVTDSESNRIKDEIATIMWIFKRLRFINITNRALILSTYHFKLEKRFIEPFYLIWKKYSMSCYAFI